MSVKSGLKLYCVMYSIYEVANARLHAPATFYVQRLMGPIDVCYSVDYREGQV